jgi:hypothetical protein
MPHIDTTVRMSSPATAVLPRVATVLAGYSQRNDITLVHRLNVADAAIGVPITVEVCTTPRETPNAVSIRLRAARHTSLFPTFEGRVQSEPAGPLESALRLIGTYEIPLGLLGEAVDETLLRHAARATLTAFLERLRIDVIDEVRRSELSVRRSILR